MIDPTTPVSDGVLATDQASLIGRRRFVQGVGAIAGAGVLATALPPAVANAALPVGASKFVALPNAVRVVDTRTPKGYRFTRIAPDRIRVPIAGDHGVSPTASALVLTLAGVNRAEPNWVVAAPSGSSIPVAANLNLRDPNEINANLVTVKLGDGGAIDVKSRVPCDVVVDVVGFYEPVAGAVREGRFVGLSTARRALDTRPLHTASGGFSMVDVTDLGVPAHASSVVVNLTATGTTGSGWFTAVPMAVRSKPTTTSLNVRGVGSTRGSAVIVPLTNVNGRLRFKIYSLFAAQLVVDVSGYFTSESSPRSTNGLFVPLTPTRMLDTREPGQIGRLWPGWVVEARVPGEAARGAAVVCNVTGVESRDRGHFRVSAARQPVPETANVNWSSPGAYVPNHVITPITSTHGLQIYSSHGAHAVVDLAGYFTGTPKAPQLPRYKNPAPPAAPPTWTLSVPRIGLRSSVIEGEPDRIVDAGHSWHWSGTGFMGQDAHVVAFAHRTSAGGPYRYLNAIQTGDTFTVTTGDRREYTYRVVRRDLTNAASSNILDAVRAHPGTTFSMVACTVGYDRTKSAYPDIWAPTSLKYRIIVTGELASWREF